MPRQRQSRRLRGISWPRGRNAPAISGLTPRACNSAAVAARSGALPARRWPSKASGNATMTAAGSAAATAHRPRSGGSDRPPIAVMPAGGPVRASVSVSRSSRQAKPVSTKPSGDDAGSSRARRRAERRCVGTIGPRSASVPALLRVVSATATARGAAARRGDGAMRDRRRHAVGSAPRRQQTDFAEARNVHQRRCRRCQGGRCRAVRARATARRSFLIWPPSRPASASGASAGPGSTMVPPSCARHCAANTAGSKP